MSNSISFLNNIHPPSNIIDYPDNAFSIPNHPDAYHQDDVAIESVISKSAIKTVVNHPAIAHIISRLEHLTPKARIIGEYIVQHPGKVVLMTTRQFAQTCGVSEATVVRFAMGMGYGGYSDLQRALKDLINNSLTGTGLTLPDRTQTDDLGFYEQEVGLDRLHRVIFEELSELRFFYETININIMNEFINHIISSPVVYIIGSRTSYTSAYHMGWSLTKVRKGIHILKGSDSTSIDTISAAPEGSLVVIIATARYPNELIKLSKLIKRLGHTLLVLTDSQNSPVNPFASLSLVVPIKTTSLIKTGSIPFTGNPSNMLCVVKYIVQEVATGQGDKLKEHQKKVEQIYLENDILFNLDELINNSRL